MEGFIYAMAPCKLFNDCLGHDENCPLGHLDCCNFTKPGTCKEGDACSFRHVPQLCRSFTAHGNCEDGDRCKFVHEVGEETIYLGAAKVTFGRGAEVIGIVPAADG